MKICRRVATYYYRHGGYRWTTFEDLLQEAYLIVLKLREHGLEYADRLLYVHIKRRLGDYYQRITKARTIKRRGGRVFSDVDLDDVEAFGSYQTRSGEQDKNSFCFFDSGRQFTIDRADFWKCYQRALSMQPERYIDAIRDVYERGEPIAAAASRRKIFPTTLSGALKRFRNSLRVRLLEDV